MPLTFEPWLRSRYDGSPGTLYLGDRLTVVKDLKKESALNCWPSRTKRSQRSIGVPLYLAPKLALYIKMRELGLKNTELSRRLGVSETVVRRMLDPKHTTDPERIEGALAMLGNKRIVISFKDAA